MAAPSGSPPGYEIVEPPPAPFQPTALDEGLTHSVEKHSPCPHSVANFREAVVERLDLDLKVDFARQCFAGCCDLTVLVLDSTKPPSHVIFDCLHLNVSSVSFIGHDATAEWELRRAAEPKATFGSGLVVRLPPGLTKVVVRVQYQTTARSTAIQWLKPEQTKGKVHPFCFTQSQAICGRSLLPCQDTPCVKTPFTFRVTVPAALVAIASGQPFGEVLKDEVAGTRTFAYKQDVPVMSYLLATVIGDLETRDIGPRSKLFAEPAIAAAAQAEYQGIVEEFIVTAQQVVGGSDYVWGSYNVAMMPSSFAYGGMENPNCTFMSASLIAGDRSLTPTLAHEITHSWMGNLVTNAFWKDFWLNEGFTRYVERRILSQMFGAPFRGLLLMVGYNDLKKNIEMLCNQGTPGLTMLEPSIDSIDPDDAFSRVPYEKGSLFLYYLEGVVGGPERMTEWLRSYVSDFQYKTLETADFKRHFLKHFADVAAVRDIDWEHWLHGEGLPDFDLEASADATLLRQCRSMADAWLAGGSSEECNAEPFKKLKAQQIMLLLDNLINAVNDGKTIEHTVLAEMDSRYGLCKTQNVEVAYRWLMLGCKSRWPACLLIVTDFLSSHGRGSYVKPLYMVFNAFDPVLARATFDKNRDFYMPVIASQVAKVVGASTAGFAVGFKCRCERCC